MEVFIKLASLSFWTKFADFHGFLALASIFLFGICFILYFTSVKTNFTIKWLRTTLLCLFIDLVLLDIAGLLIYMPYRAPGGSRSLLLSSEQTSWLHQIIFEHKEFLAFAPPILIYTAFSIVNNLRDDFGNIGTYLWLRRSVITAIILALVFVLVVAGEAVLVTKVAPV